MTVLKFEGLVEMGDDEYRVSDPFEDEPGFGDYKEGSLYIGGRDVVAEIEATSFEKPVIVATADERWEGPLAVMTGWGYSEYTPMDPDELQVGDHDLIKLLLRHEGEHLTLWVADEPMNLLEVE